ncbi:unnamed protein product [Prunus armeniaca]|uniref:Uncharacterized protein n=1 Tax=Prunus armeniaca TaxID=36596 RepID=A0A6J5Y3R4_PRUAR|nr:unnamed protein product [Prunus armeniaca]
MENDSSMEIYCLATCSYLMDKQSWVILDVMTKCFDAGGEIKNLKGAEKILSEMVRVVELKLKKQLKRAAKPIVGGLSNENSSIRASKILEKMHVA